MRIMLIFGLVFISMGLSTCKKEPPIEPKPPFYQPPPSVLETLWTTPLQGFSINPMLNSNGDVLMSSIFNNTGKGEIIKLFDKNTGQLKWEWSDYFKPEEGFSDGLYVQKNDVLVLSARKNNYALDMITGQTIWKNTIDSMSAEPQIYKDEDGYIYKGFSSITTKSTVYIFRAMYNTGNWEWVCTYKDPNPIDGRFEIASIGVTKNTKGEKIVAFTIYTNYPNSQDSTKALIMGYNLTTNRFDWEKNYRNVLVEFTVAMYTNNKRLVYPFAFGYDQKMLIAIDVNNGEIVWHKKLPDLGAQISFYKENLIVTCLGQSPVYCYNQATGSIVWQQLFSQFSDKQKTELNFNFGESTLFKNYHLSTQCDNLLVLDADNGNVLFYDKTALPEGCLQNGMAIDEKRRVFYAEDRQRVICYKLPDAVKY